MDGAKPKDKGVGGFLRDAGLSLAKGVVAVPEAVVGLADIATGGRAGKFLENEGGAVGFRPKQAKEFLSSLHTEKYQDQQRQFQEADGIFTAPEFRSALREFAGIQQAIAMPDKIKEMEQAMIGRRAEAI